MSLIMVPLNSLFTLQNGKLWLLPKIQNETLKCYKCETERGIITAHLHKVDEDFRYLHSISSLRLCWMVKGRGEYIQQSLTGTVKTLTDFC